MRTMTRFISERKKHSEQTPEVTGEKRIALADMILYLRLRLKI